MCCACIFLCILKSIYTQPKEKFRNNEWKVYKNNSMLLLCKLRYLPMTLIIIIRYVSLLIVFKLIFYLIFKTNWDRPWQRNSRATKLLDRVTETCADVIWETWGRFVWRGHKCSRWRVRSRLSSQVTFFPLLHIAHSLEVL